MSAYQAYLDWRAERIKEAEEKGRQEAEARMKEAEEQARREAEARVKEAEEQARQEERKLIEKFLRQQGKTEEEIQRFLQQLDALGNLEKKLKD